MVIENAVRRARVTRYKMCPHTLKENVFSETASYEISQV